MNDAEPVPPKLRVLGFLDQTVLWGNLGISLLGLVGTDVLTGQERFTLGVPQLSDGIDVIVVAVAHTDLDGGLQRTSICPGRASP